MRYLGVIYKLTTLPYLRQMVVIEAISREIKKIYRDYQREYCLSEFRLNHRDMMSEAYGLNKTKSLKTVTLRKLKRI